MTSTSDILEQSRAILDLSLYNLYIKKNFYKKLFGYKTDN